MNHRREFIKSVSALAATRALAEAFPRDQTKSFRGPICLFSKHLPGMNWTQLAQAVKRLGFAGVDLTVRPGGHVLPERAAEDLPKAVAAIRAEGVSVPMITTGLTSKADPAAKPILETAGRLSIPFFKPGYYKYQFLNVRSELEKAMSDFSGLVELSAHCGVAAGFHNHEGNIGAQLWDVATTIDRLDSKRAGYYFDVRHAVCEGGSAGWKIAFNLIAPKLKMIAIKDFYWDRTARGWRQIDCPLGEGMVDWKTYFKMLRVANFEGPVSLHLEYEIQADSQKAREEKTLLAAQRDFEFLRARLNEAYSE